MKKLSLSFAVILLATAATSSAFASVMTYRMSIDGNSDAVQAPLAAGTHTLEVEVIVTDNIVLNMDAGVLQSSFSLSTDNGGFTFVDTMGGLIGGPDGKWDSDDVAPPFDSWFPGSTTNGGGPTVSDETAAFSPSSYINKFQEIGANAYSLVASGDFTYDALDTHPASLNLTTALNIVRVAALNATEDGIISVPPDEVLGATIAFQEVDPNSVGGTPPVVNDQMAIFPKGETSMYQLLGTDAEDGDDANLSWDWTGLSGPGAPAIAPTLSPSGLLSWDTTGSARGFYTSTITATDSDGMMDDGLLTVQVPEPGVFVLAGMSLIGIVASRRRLS